MTVYILAELQHNGDVSLENSCVSVHISSELPKYLTQWKIFRTQVTETKQNTLFVRSYSNCKDRTAIIKTKVSRRPGIIARCVHFPTSSVLSYY